MNRRQFVVGIGALAGGGGALVGSGAFTSVDADRTAAVAVAEEDEAYLTITPSPNTANGAFAGQTPSNNGEVINLDFNEEIPTNANPVGGKGVGQSSVYEFDDVFRIQNQGTQAVYVNITNVTTHGGHTTVRFYVRDGSGNRQFVTPGTNDLEATVGTEYNIGVYIDTAEESNYSTSGADSGTATITADASSDDTVVSP